MVKKYDWFSVRLSLVRNTEPRARFTWKDGSHLVLNVEVLV